VEAKDETSRNWNCGGKRRDEKELQFSQIRPIKANCEGIRKATSDQELQIQAINKQKNKTNSMA
jgi:hypothetical protein